MKFRFTRSAGRAAASSGTVGREMQDRPADGAAAGEVGRAMEPALRAFRARRRRRLSRDAEHGGSASSWGRAARGGVEGETPPGRASSIDSGRVPELHSVKPTSCLSRDAEVPKGGVTAASPSVSWLGDAV